MATITIEIDKGQDVSALKDYLSQSGYRYEFDEEEVEYTPEFKAELDRRYEEYVSGKVPAITAEESRR
jgi:hypothetical protein